MRCSKVSALSFVANTRTNAVFLKTDIFRNIAIRETFTHIVSTDNFRRQYTDKGNFNLTPLSVAQQVRPINFHLIVCAIRAESESR